MAFVRVLKRIHVFSDEVRAATRARPPQLLNETQFGDLHELDGVNEAVVRVCSSCSCRTDGALGDTQALVEKATGLREALASAPPAQLLDPLPTSLHRRPSGFPT